jgi:hypothetical protein
MHGAFTAGDPMPPLESRVDGGLQLGRNLGQVRDDGLSESSRDPSPSRRSPAGFTNASRPWPSTVITPVLMLRSTSSAS